MVWCCFEFFIQCRLSTECESSGCCWAPSSRPNVPWCFHGPVHATPTVPYTPTPPPYTTPTPFVLTGIRLVGGEGPWEGRLEIEVYRYHPLWGTVCDDEFTRAGRNARVICRQLGFSGGESFGQAYFGPGDENQPILMDELSCGGHELSIDECQHHHWGDHDCDHSEDVGISKCVLCTNVTNCVITLFPFHFFRM